jgi:ribosomal protein S18 acetylase RimI-like enzyme
MPEKRVSAKGDWRAMRPADIATVLTVAARVHPDFPEDATVFEERLRLFPLGCFVYDREGEVLAYVLSHPWHGRKPPALNTLLDALPVKPETYYLHDIALLPALRGTGAASRMVTRLVAVAEAEKLLTLSLVAVNSSTGFWRRHGFHPVADLALTEHLKSYDDAAAFMVRTLG